MDLLIVRAEEKKPSGAQIKGQRRHYVFERCNTVAAVVEQGLVLEVLRALVAW